MKIKGWAIVKKGKIVKDENGEENILKPYLFYTDKATAQSELYGEGEEVKKATIEIKLA